MKFNADWLYDEFKDALGTLGLNWGEKHLMTIQIDEQKGEITFRGNGRSFSVPICEETKP